MKIEVALTKEIIDESLPVHYRRTSFVKQILQYTTPILLMVYGIVFTVLQSNYTYGLERYVYLIMISVIAILSALWTTYRRNTVGKKILKLLGDRTHYEVDASEDGLISQFSDARYEQKWTVFPKAVISKQLVLLYQQNKMFTIFHHSFFSNEDFNRFKELVRHRTHQVIED